MVRQALGDPKTRERRLRRARDTRAWRSRVRRHVDLYKIEAGMEEIDLCIRFGGLLEKHISDKTAVAHSLGRLLRRALVSLLREESANLKRM